jgi:DNA-binding beta-propeller fold protein YncE
MLFACGGSGSNADSPNNPNIEDTYFKNITSFSLPSQNGLVDGVINGNKISVTMPYGTDLTSLVATFETDGSSVNIGGITQISGTTSNNFTSPVIYVVTAADGSTQNYTVTVTVAPKSAKAITAYSLDGTDGVIDGQNIAVTLPFGTDVTALVATFTTSGENVTVGGTAQVSGVTPNNFTSPVIYVVTAADGSTRNYTVTVTIEVFSNPHAIILNSDGTLAYVANLNSNTVSRCFVNPTTGVFSDCANTGGTGFTTPAGIALNSSGTFAYVTNYFSNTVTSCSVDKTTGVFSACADTKGTGFSAPNGIRLNSNGKFAYVTNSGANSVSKCSVANGVFSNCANTGTGFSSPSEVRLNSAGTLAYVTNFGNNTVTSCSVNILTGDFLDCANTGGTGFNLPTSIALNSAGTLAYVTNRSLDTVTSCSVDITTGAFSNCANTGGTGFSVPTGIALNNAGTLAYVTNSMTNSVSKCSVNTTTGAFSDCEFTGK